MPTKRLSHLLGFLASFKNHSSSRHNPTQPLSHQKRRKRYGRERERQRGRGNHPQTLAQIVSKTFGAVAGGSCALSRGKKAAHFGSVYCRGWGASGGDGPPLKRLFGIPFIFMFLRSLPICPTPFTCLAPSAETLTPNEKRQQIIHHFAFRLGNISSGKSYATQLGYCSRWWWPSAPPTFVHRALSNARAQPRWRWGKKYYLERFIINFMCDFSFISFSFHFFLFNFFLCLFALCF